MGIGEGRSLRVVALLAWVSAAACGGGPTMGMPDAGGGDAGGGPDTGTANDTGTPDAGLVLGFEVAPPDIPWLEDGTPPIARPVLTPCPDGWYETELAGETICEPWPAGATQDCPPGEAHLLGSPGCAPLGGPCPTGDFADDLPTDQNVVHVREGAATGGDGSLAAPYATLAEALATNPPEDTILALGKGSYEGAVMPPGLTLWGACPAETTVHEPAGAPYAIELTAGTLEIRRIRMEPLDATALHVAGAGTVVTLRAIEVRGATCNGVEVFDEALLDAEQILVRDTRAACVDPETRAHGVFAQGAVLHVLRSHFANNGDAAITAVTTPEHGTATEVLLEDTIVRDHRGIANAPHAVWIGSWPAGTTTAPVTGAVRRVVIEDNHAGGLMIAGEHTTVDVDQVLARHNGSQPAIDFFLVTQPVSFFFGAQLHLRRSAITGSLSNLQYGAIHGGQYGPSTIEDIVVANNNAKGLNVWGSEAPLSARRVRFSDNTGGDLGLSGATLRVEDGELGGNSADDGDLLAAPLGIHVTAYAQVAHLELTRVRIQHAAGAGVYMSIRDGAGSLSATLDDVAIVHTRPLIGAGWSIFGGFGTNLTARRVLLEGNHTSAIELVSGIGSSLVLEDSVIRDTRPYPGEDVGGRGISISSGTAEICRTRIEGTHELGFGSFGSTASLEDVEIRRTRTQACAGRGACLPHGHALGVYDSSLTATRFIVSDADTCGIHFARSSEVDLTQGLVQGTRIGACVQVDGYDVDRLSNGVLYIDNERNLDATELPVPDPGG